MRKLIGTSLLVLALSLTVRAGEIPFPVDPQPTPTSSTTPGEIPFPGGAEQSATTEAVISLLGSLLSLL